MNEGHRKWWILFAATGVLAMVILDESVLGVALPTIRSELGLSIISGHWVINAYLLVFCMLVAAGGKFGDVLGRTRMFICGAVVFGVSSLACGLAESGAMLIAARASQGIGGAIIFPASVAMISAAFPVEQRGLAFGIQTAGAAIAMSTGPLVGGLFTELYSWRWVFWINVPVALAVTGVALATCESHSRPNGQSLGRKLASIDWRGLGALVIGLGALVFGIMEAPERGWLAPLTMSSMIGGAIVMATFVVLELRSSNPLIELRLFGNATFTASNLVVFAGQFAKLTVIVFGAIYLQRELRFSALQAGTALLAAVAPTLLTSLPAGRLSDRFGSRWPTLIATLLNVFALLWLAYFVDWKDFGILVPALILWGTTLPFHFVPPRRAVMSAVPPEKHGQASGVNIETQIFAATVGMTVCGTLLAITSDFRIVYLVAAGIVCSAFLVGLFALDRQPAIARERGGESRLR